MSRGLFIVVEGMDNVGKSTFVKEYCERFPLTQKVKLPTPEVYSYIKLAPKEEWHNVFHKNIDSVSKEINKMLNAGMNVIADRYIYSHFVYEAMTSGTICSFYLDITPNAIVYLRHSDPKSLPKKDMMEHEVDYELGQKYFEKLFRKSGIPNVTLKALQPDTVKLGIMYLSQLFGKRLYVA